MRVVHFKKEAYTQYIGRPSMWGNPHALGFGCKLCSTADEIVEHGRTEAVELFEEYARKNPKLLEAIKDLPEDSVLGCWCSPRLCHGDVIIKLWKEMHGVTDPPVPG